MCTPFDAHFSGQLLIDEAETAWRRHFLSKRAPAFSTVALHWVKRHTNPLINCT